MDAAAKFLIGGGAVAGLAWLLWPKTAHAAALDPATAGKNDGCTQGTADGKAGLVLLNATDAASNDVLAAKAKASGDPTTYVREYAKAYDSCYAAAAPPPAPSAGPAAPPPTAVKPPPGVSSTSTAAQRAAALTAYTNGCADGTSRGYSDGVNGWKSSPYAAPSVASASGNAAAYSAGYTRSYNASYLTGQALNGIPGAPSNLTIAQATEANASCATYFDAWYLEWVAAGKPSTGVAGYLPGKGITVAGRTVVGAAARPFSISGHGGHGAMGPSMRVSAPNAMRSSAPTSMPARRPPPPPPSPAPPPADRRLRFKNRFGLFFNDIIVVEGLYPDCYWGYFHTWPVGAYGVVPVIPEGYLLLGTSDQGYWSTEPVMGQSPTELCLAPWRARPGQPYVFAY
jgi:hypothetical protein